MMDQITPEQKKQLDKLGQKFLAKSFWNGIHYGFMAAVMNILLYMGAAIFFDGDSTLLMVGSLVIGIFVTRSLMSVFREDALKLQEDAKKIIKN
jgi:hypothetical protein